jgi:hypothetical protein
MTNDFRAQLDKADAQWKEREIDTIDSLVVDLRFELMSAARNATKVEALTFLTKDPWLSHHLPLHLEFVRRNLTDAITNWNRLGQKWINTPSLPVVAFDLNPEVPPPFHVKPASAQPATPNEEPDYAAAI